MSVLHRMVRFINSFVPSKTGHEYNEKVPALLLNFLILLCVVQYEKYSILLFPQYIYNFESIENINQVFVFLAGVHFGEHGVVNFGLGHS